MFFAVLVLAFAFHANAATIANWKAAFIAAGCPTGTLALCSGLFTTTGCNTNTVTKALTFTFQCVGGRVVGVKVSSVLNNFLSGTLTPPADSADLVSLQMTPQNNLVAIDLSAVTGLTRLRIGHSVVDDEFESSSASSNLGSLTSLAGLATLSNLNELSIFAAANLPNGVIDVTNMPGLQVLRLGSPGAAGVSPIGAGLPLVSSLGTEISSLSSLVKLELGRMSSLSLGEIDFSSLTQLTRLVIVQVPSLDGTVGTASLSSLSVFAQRTNANLTGVCRKPLGLSPSLSPLRVCAAVNNCFYNPGNCAANGCTFSQVACGVPECKPSTAVTACGSPSSIGFDLFDATNPSETDDIPICLTFKENPAQFANAAAPVECTVTAANFGGLGADAAFEQKFTSCSLSVNETTGNVISFSLSGPENSNGASMTVTEGTVNPECGQAVSILFGGNRKRQTVSSSTTTAGFLIAAVTAKGDPHMRGANGVGFEFVGVKYANYSLFSAPQYQVTMHMSPDGSKAHYMTQVGLMFRGFSTIIGVGSNLPFIAKHANATLAPLGGHAVLLAQFKIKFQFCHGHSVTISQLRTVDPKLFVNNTPFHYLDVEIDVPGCHDAYDGVLGQTYKCKYELGNEKFVWSQALENSFRVPSLLTSFGAFNKKATC